MTFLNANKRFFSGYGRITGIFMSRPWLYVSPMVDVNSLLAQMVKNLPAMQETQV